MEPLKNININLIIIINLIINIIIGRFTRLETTNSLLQ